MPERRTLAQVTGLDDPTTEDVPAVAWDFRACVCGVVFYGPASRTRCMACRTGAVVARESDEDDEEGQGPMAELLGIDEASVRQSARAKEPAAEVCRRFGVNASQFVNWCYRKRIDYPGAPRPNTLAVAALQAEIEAPTAPVTILPPAAAIEAQIRAEVEADADLERDRQAVVAAAAVLAEQASVAVADSVVAVSQPEPEEALVVDDMLALVAAPETMPEAAPETEPEALPNPFRAAVREGGLILPIRIEESRIVIREPEIEGSITDVEAEHVLAWLRGWMQERAGVEVVVEPCA